MISKMLNFTMDTLWTNFMVQKLAINIPLQYVHKWLSNYVTNKRDSLAASLILVVGFGLTLHLNNIHKK